MGSNDRKRRHSYQPNRIARHRLDPNRFQSRHVLDRSILAPARNQRPIDESGRINMRKRTAEIKWRVEEEPADQYTPNGKTPNPESIRGRPRAGAQRPGMPLSG